MRLSFFRQEETDKAKPLIIEAKEGAGTLRLKAIRDQIKTTYGALREREALTRMFRQDLQEFSAAMKQAQGTEELCATIEELMKAEYISREDYSKVYTSVRRVFQSQAESIIDTVFTSRIESELAEMGYQLLDEEGNPVKLSQGKIHTLDTPYDDYQLRVRVGEDKSITTRLVRTVGSEAEKSSVSEYQRQKDIETGRKLCSDLDRIHSNLRNDGLILHEVMRKEPDEEDIDVAVDKSKPTRPPRGTTSKQSAPQQRAAHSES